MESVAYRLADVYDALRPLAAPEHEIVAVRRRHPRHALLAPDHGRRPRSHPDRLDAGDETTARGAALMAAVEAGILPGLEADPDVAGGASRYDPDMANHERYRAGRDRQARLEQALVLTGEFV